MWWNDIQQIKEWMNLLNAQLTRIENGVEKIVMHAQEQKDKNFSREDVEDCLINIRDAFCPEDECSSINRIHDKLNSLVEDVNRDRAVVLATKTLDKFDDYMKNVDKLNEMINEFKGCVSAARSALAERKQMDKEIKEMKNVAELSHQIHHSMVSFIEAAETMQERAHFKINAIYSAVCENEEEKPKKKKTTKKKPNPSP